MDLSRVLAPSVRLAGAAAVCLLAACGADSAGSGDGSQETTTAEASSSSSSPETPSASDSAADPTPATPGGEGATDCTLMSAEQASDLAGADLSGPEDQVIGDVTACHWRAGTRYVQLIAVPAVVWGASLPAAIEQVKAGGLLDDPANAAKLEQAEELLGGSAPATDEQACEVFGVLVDIQGAGETDKVVNIVPTREDPLAVTAQLCRDGRFTSVLVADTDGLADAEARVDAVDAAVEQAHAGGARS